MNEAKFNLNQRSFTALGAVILLSVLAPGCATKKWVQTKVMQPLETKITGVDKKTDENSTKIKDNRGRPEGRVGDR